MSSTIAVIVPTYFRNPHAVALDAGFDAFFAQFAMQREDNFAIFLSDSGPASSQGIIEARIQQVLQQHQWLQQRVHYHYQVTDGPPLSRADAMNLGVAMTDGDYLLFLHIDCRLTPGGLAQLRHAFDNGAKGGGFLKKYTEHTTLSPLLLTEQYLNWLRTWWGHHLVGTNGIFLLRELAIEHPYHGIFMEDVELSDWLRQRLQGPQWQLLRTPIEVSTRKYNKLGVWPSLAVNLSVMTLYRVFGLPAAPLKDQLYHKDFPKGWRFWPQWSKAALDLLRQHNTAQTDSVEQQRDPTRPDSTIRPDSIAHQQTTSKKHKP